MFELLKHVHLFEGMIATPLDEITWMMNLSFLALNTCNVTGTIVRIQPVL